MAMGKLTNAKGDSLTTPRQLKGGGGGTHKPAPCQLKGIQEPAPYQLKGGFTNPLRVS